MLKLKKLKNVNTKKCSRRKIREKDDKKHLKKYKKEGYQKKEEFYRQIIRKNEEHVSMRINYIFH